LPERVEDRGVTKPEPVLPGLLVGRGDELDDAGDAAVEHLVKVYASTELVKELSSQLDICRRAQQSSRSESSLT
jgi:hypothetical protein